MLEKEIQQVFAQVPDVLYGYTDISYSSFSQKYKSALVFAVPYEKQLTLEAYTEEEFENSIQKARKRVEAILNDIEDVLKSENVKYYIPPVAQQNEEELLALFSFKYAAVNAGLGWIGKNDVLITEQYGPRVRLSAVLVDYVFEYGVKITESKCPADCRKCIDICPHKVLTGGEWNINAQRSDLIDYHLCNRKRSEYIEKHGRKNACGLCLVVCPYGEKINVTLELVCEENKYIYEKFEEVYDSNLSRFQSRIYPRNDCEAVRWYYIKHDNDYIGSVWLEKIKNTEYADLGVFIAYEEYRNRGIGTFAIQTILKDMKLLKISEVHLRVRKENLRAQNCYHKIGFVDKRTMKKDNGILVVEMVY